VLPLNIGVAGLLTYAGLHYLFATTFGIGVQLVLTFFINRRFTFAKTEIGAHGGLFRTVLVELTSTTNILILTATAVEVLHFEFTTARISAMCIAGILGYILDSFFTFRTSPFK
jgi:putative flippase GtrA